MRDFEEVREQADRKTRAELELKAALARLAHIAKAAARTLDLAPVFGAVAQVRRTEEELDLATLDLATARGEDA